jgi:hypothetical protein
VVSATKSSVASDAPLTRRERHQVIGERTPSRCDEADQIVSRERRPLTTAQRLQVISSICDHWVAVNALQYSAAIDCHCALLR